MSDMPFLAEIRLMSCGFAPSGWAQCDGQLMAVNSNQPLFSLLGTTYGGNGVTTFALPDLRGQVAMHAGNGHPPGQVVGEPTHKLTLAEMPAHTHSLAALKGPGTVPFGLGSLLAASPNLYGPPGSDLAAIGASSVSTVGADRPHENRQPYLVLTYCIALSGVFPSRN